MCVTKFGRLCLFAFSVMACLAFIQLEAHAECRLDWNNDGAIDQDDAYVADTGNPCLASGFWAEINIYLSQPVAYPICFPGKDHTLLDYNGDGVINYDDYMSQSGLMDGFYNEYYVYQYYRNYFIPIYQDPSCLMDHGTCEDACNFVDYYDSRDDVEKLVTLAECKQSCAALYQVARFKYPEQQVDDIVNDDIADFRYCAFNEAQYGVLHVPYCDAQGYCDDFETCNVLLYNPTLTMEVCQDYCACAAGTSDMRLGLSAALSPLTAYYRAPKGYRFARNKVFVKRGKKSLDYKKAYKAKAKSGRRFSLLSFDKNPGARQLAKLNRDEVVMPSFVDESDNAAAATGVIFVKITIPEGHENLRQVLNSFEGLSALQEKNSPTVYRIECFDGWEALELAEVLTDTAGFHFELDMIREYRKFSEPTDVRFPDQWNLENTGQDGAIEGVDIRVVDAWQETHGNSDIAIAIMDDFVDIEHQEFEGRIIESDSDYHPDDWKERIQQYHGTEVAGVAAAGMDTDSEATGSVGVCPSCSILPVHIELLDFFESDDSIQTKLKYAADHADVINCSFGLSYRKLPFIIQEALAYAENSGRVIDGVSYGTLVVVAAGNDGIDVAANQRFSNVPTTILVSAVDDQGLKSYFSAFGDEITIAAPSHGGLTNGITAPTSCPSTLYSYQELNLCGEVADSLYKENFGGTSAAAPQVSGVIGLMLSVNPRLTATQVRNILRKSARKIDPVWGQWKDGRHSPFYGAGLVNAYTAVMMSYPEGDPRHCAIAADCQAPSDDCGDNCDRTVCSTCRTHNDCSEGFVCQSLPDLGIKTCVEQTSADTCTNGYEKHGDYCVPTQETFSNCETGSITLPEVTDEGRCLNSGEGCEAGETCDATFCKATCTTDDDCPEAKTCNIRQDRYGAIDLQNSVCGSSVLNHPAFSCLALCTSAVSTYSWGEFNQFNTCVVSQTESCTEVNPDLCDVELTPTNLFPF